MKIRIAIEGADGTGKTSVAAKVYEALSKGHPSHKSVLLREPGGTHLGEWVRDNLLFPKFREPYDHTTMRLGFVLSHSDVVNSLHQTEKSHKDTIVVLDRYSPYSNYVYERYGDELSATWFTPVYFKLMTIWKPDHIFVLDPDLDMEDTVIERSKMHRANTNWMDLEADKKAKGRIYGYKVVDKFYSNMPTTHIRITKETTIDDLVSQILEHVHRIYKLED